MFILLIVVLLCVKLSNNIMQQRTRGLTTTLYLQRRQSTHVTISSFTKTRPPFLPTSSAWMANYRNVLLIVLNTWMITEYLRLNGAKLSTWLGDALGELVVAVISDASDGGLHKIHPQTPSTISHNAAHGITRLPNCSQLWS